MKLTQFTDYSLRVLIYLAHTGKSTSVRELCTLFDVSPNHLSKAVMKLAALQYIETARGKNGGIKLAIDPSRVYIGDLVREIETNFDLVECFDHDTDQCRISPACRLKGILQEARAAFFQTLNQYSLADVVKNKTQLLQLIA